MKASPSLFLKLERWKDQTFLQGAEITYLPLQCTVTPSSGRYARPACTPEAIQIDIRCLTHWASSCAGYLATTALWGGAAKTEFYPSATRISRQEPMEAIPLEMMSIYTCDGCH